VTPATCTSAGPQRLGRRPQFNLSAKFEFSGSEMSPIRRFRPPELRRSAARGLRWSSDSLSTVALHVSRGLFDQTPVTQMRGKVPEFTPQVAHKCRNHRPPPELRPKVAQFSAEFN
jgi:hypothetical protein